MPRGDGTGPLGRGPMTGRGMGYCVVKLPEDDEPPRGYAGAAGRPVGAGMPAQSELGIIRDMLNSLAWQVEDIQARIYHLRRKEG